LLKVKVKVESQVKHFLDITKHFAESSLQVEKLTFLKKLMLMLMRYFWWFFGMDFVQYLKWVINLGTYFAVKLANIEEAKK
jgi:hypothetical protein